MCITKLSPIRDRLMLTSLATSPALLLKATHEVSTTCLTAVAVFFHAKTQVSIILTTIRLARNILTTRTTQVTTKIPKICAFVEHAIRTSTINRRMEGTPIALAVTMSAPKRSTLRPVLGTLVEALVIRLARSSRLTRVEVVALLQVMGIKRHLQAIRTLGRPRHAPTSMSIIASISAWPRTFPSSSQ